MAGPVLASVTDVNDPEQMGRVKVKFPSMGGEVDSDWARVVAPGAGKNRGFDMRPQIDDVVLVVFEHGDTRFPLVLGGVWTKHVSHADPKIGDTGVERASVRSTSGSALSFFDKGKQPSHDKANPGAWSDVKTEGGIGLTSSDTKTGLIVADAGAMIAADKTPITFTNGEASITMKDDGSIEIKGTDLKIEMSGDTTIISKGKVAVESKQEAGVKGPGGEFKADAATVKIKSPGVVELKGGLVKING